MIINIAVCDDKYEEIERISKEIDNIFSKYSYKDNQIGIYKYTDPNKLIEDYEAKPYDLVFLDIEMPLLDGFAVAEILVGISPDVKIVFVTSHDGLVYDSFRYTPIEFIRKSNLSGDIAKKGKFIFSRIQKPKESYIIVQNNANIELRLSDIVYIENIRNDIKVYTYDDNIHTLQRKTLQTFINELNYGNIVQIHKSYAVNIEYLHTSPKYDSIQLMKDDITLPIGRKFRNDLNDRFFEYARGFTK